MTANMKRGKATFDMKKCFKKFLVVMIALMILVAVPSAVSAAEFDQGNITITDLGDGFWQVSYDMVLDYHHDRVILVKYKPLYLASHGFGPGNLGSFSHEGDLMYARHIARGQHNSKFVFWLPEGMELQVDRSIEPFQDHIQHTLFASAVPKPTPSPTPAPTTTREPSKSPVTTTTRQQPAGATTTSTPPPVVTTSRLPAPGTTAQQTTQTPIEITTRTLPLPPTTTPATPAPAPKTGDNSAIFAFVAITMIAGASAIVVWKKRRAFFD